MVKYKETLFIFLILFFLIFSFSPTLFELSKANKLADPNREFVLEHNYYWPDFNLYLSKIRQGYEGRLTALERYTSEPHRGSLIQEFYVLLGFLGKRINLDPNFSYQLGRLILSPLLLLITFLLVRFYFRSFFWQIVGFAVIFVSGSFPRLFYDSQGILHIGRYMEWWSNIDTLQRITFIPHILFGQVIAFYLLYKLTLKNSYPATAGSESSGQAIKQCNNVTMKQLIIYILLGNAAGLVFPPSLITLDGAVALTILVKIFKRCKNPKFEYRNPKQIRNSKFKCPKQNVSNLGFGKLGFVSNFVLRASNLGFRIYKNIGLLGYWVIGLLFIILTLPSLLYFLIITKYPPWSALVISHRNHPMMIPFWEYILGTGPVFFLGLAGGIVSILRKDRKFQPLIYWILVTFGFAIIFTHIKEQSPLRFTQTGLFIPLGILSTYLFYSIFHLCYLNRLLKPVFITAIIFYILCSLYMMKTSLNWQTTFIKQRVGANYPPVPYPPQTMYPLKQWMDGIRWLRNNTEREDTVLAEITAGNFIPAYAGNIVYFGQTNTVDYERKQAEAWQFFKGEMKEDKARLFFAAGRIKYIFFSFQEKEKSGEKNLLSFYPFLIPVYTNPNVTIFTFP